MEKHKKTIKTRSKTQFFHFFSGRAGGSEISYFTCPLPCHELSPKIGGRGRPVTPPRLGIILDSGTTT